jgi:hypothetical protein
MGWNRASVTHGMFGTPEYNTWAHMIQRCYNPKYPSWRDYGARGITVCERWMATADPPSISSRGAATIRCWKH